MKMRLYPCVVLFVLTVLAARAQTWVGGFGNGNANGFNVFNVANNWNPASVPANNGTANLVFSGAANAFPGVDIAFSVNSLAFSSISHYFMGTPNGSTLSIGAGGITVATTNGGGNDYVDFNSPLPIALSASQPWTPNGNLSVYGIIPDGGNGYLLTKAGTGYLALGGNNTYSGGTTVSAGTLYLGQNNNNSTDTPIGNGTLTLQAGATLGTLYGDVTLSNAVSFASGATLGGSLNNGGGGGHIELGGTV